MTKSLLKINVSAVMAFLISLIVLAVVSRHYDRTLGIYGVIKDFSSLFIALAAVYLAYCFQRRQNFLIALSALWREIVSAKIEVIDYIDSAKPDDAAFAKVNRALSETIDLVRGVYQNVGESETTVGLYPFEPLHDMRRALESLRADLTPERRTIERMNVDRAWNALRFAFLKEFSRPPPPWPILQPGSLDPRRHDDQTALRPMKWNRPGKI